MAKTLSFKLYYLSHIIIISNVAKVESILNFYFTGKQFGMCLCQLLCYIN